MSSTPALPSLHRLRDFVTAFAALLDTGADEPRILDKGGALLAELIAHDDWLPEAYTQADAQYYRQYLLHADSAERFSVVSFVWGPGQHTPVHDHKVWGLIGVLRGAEIAQPYAQDAQGQCLPAGPAQEMRVGQVAAVSPRIGDVHRVSNAYADRISISIHVYGANIGAVHRTVYAADGSTKPFISGYSNTELPNIWDRSKENP